MFSILCRFYVDVGWVDMGGDGVVSLILKELDMYNTSKPTESFVRSSLFFYFVIGLHFSVFV
jgi:hypothetical protein